jgi:peptidoglycan/LPS O-acetylase OafA/YrhL
MAAAAEKRRNELLISCVTRYLRLALPVTASCLVAWMWLSAFPNATQTLQQTVDNPSRWLNYTYQEPILPVWYAAADGMVGNFVRGFSRFNNVLWTMQFELLGSLGIFFLYFFSTGKLRLMILLVSAVVIVRYLPASYFAFVLGAGLYEAHKRDALQGLPAVLPALALLGAILLGSPGEGAHERLHLPDVPAQWEVGRPRGLISIVAAGLLLYAVLMLPLLARVLSTRLPIFLGRISFGLYLVHVPPLYTIVAWSAVNGVPEPVIAVLYGCGTIILAYGFTVLIDEPVLTRLSALRARLGGKAVPKARVEVS